MRTNHRGRILSMGLCTRDHEEFEVSDTPLADMLRDYLGEEIVAQCVLVPGGRATQAVKLVDFAPIPAGRGGVWLAGFDGEDPEDLK